MRFRRSNADASGHASDDAGGRRTRAALTGGGSADLVERLRRGDEEAFEILVRAHAARLLAVARRYLRSEEDARDAVQEGFSRGSVRSRGFTAARACRPGSTAS